MILFDADGQSVGFGFIAAFVPLLLAALFVYPILRWWERRQGKRGRR
jgi:hypothetical protein